MEELLQEIIDTLRAANNGAAASAKDATKGSVSVATSSAGTDARDSSHDAACADANPSANAALSPEALETIIRRHNRSIRDNARHHSKKKILDYYLDAKENNPALWESWDIDETLEQRILATLRVKPRRTASGVATITVITKPHACASACLYCPNDVRMPKSYLANEPACQRAERTWFDPYLQVAARLRSLSRMGHVTDKVELIVLGGTWDDYPEGYRIWFVAELFRALNEAGTPSAKDSAERRRTFYEELGISNDPEALARSAAEIQRRVTEGEIPFNRAMGELYGKSPAWQAAATMQVDDLRHIEALHAQNENAAHRCVGLVIETRPDMVTQESLLLMRRLGCTKIQMGVQSLDDRILEANRRGIGTDRIARAFALARLFGFKTHAHFMANLYGATPEDDVRGYERLMNDERFRPDEVKMYPCALIGSAALMESYENGSWRPYTERQLVDVLARNVLATPPWTRISRMIRDFSSVDVVDGNKKVNLREVVEAEAQRRARASMQPIQEIRHREISTRNADIDTLELTEVPYATSTGREVFLQWTTPEGLIAGFLRLSMPDEAAALPFPIARGEAMIREVHVYGAVAGIHQEGKAAQHRGLGRRLVERACEIAREAGYGKINVISAVGTREYYRGLGFEPSHEGLYQQKNLAIDSQRGNTQEGAAR